MDFPHPRDLLPQDPPMVLIDEVVSWADEVVRCAAVVRREPGFDLPPLGEVKPETGSDEVPALLCLEYMAQTIGCAVGIMDMERGRKLLVGFLLGTREMNLRCTHLKVGRRLEVQAQRIFGDDKLGSFRCEVFDPEQGSIADATLNVFAGKLEEVVGEL